MDDQLAVHRLVQAVRRDRMTDDTRTIWADAALGFVNALFPRDILTNPEAWPVCDALTPHALTVSGAEVEAASAEPEQMAALLNQLGLYVHLVLANLNGARASLERARAIDEAAFGPDHPRVATGVNNLGSVLESLGDLDGARASYERALAIFIRFLPPDHPDIRIVRGNLESLQN